MQTVSYNVASIEYSDEEKIQEAIFPIFGVNKVSVAKDDNELIIWYDESLVTEEAITESLKSMGFRLK
jgi:predicted RNA binding protein with dsRBD fold (UPF0201 family)